MATLESLTELIVNIIQDDTFTPLITSYINQGINEIAGGMQSSLGDHITPPLPELFTIDTVSTSEDDAYVDMPSTYQRNLQMAVSAAGYEIDVYNSMIIFSKDYPSLSTSGSLNAVIDQGNTLYYQGIPTTSEEVTLHFYRFPINLVSVTDVPDGIPLHLQVPLIVNHVAWKMFDLIEDGTDDVNTNTQKYMGLFANALRTLELSIPYEARTFEAYHG